MPTITRKGWMVAFIPPETLELMRDYVMSGKGDSFGLQKIDWIPKYAVEEFLYHNGYMQQIAEIRKARHTKTERTISMDYLNDAQRHAAVVLMNERNLSEEQAIKWVVEHKGELAEIRQR